MLPHPAGYTLQTISTIFVKRIHPEKGDGKNSAAPTGTCRRNEQFGRGMHPKAYATLLGACSAQDACDAHGEPRGGLLVFAPILGTRPDPVQEC